MTLCSYRIATLFLKAGLDKTEDLPTPYQFGLVLSTLEGRVVSLWNFTRYWRLKRKDVFNTPVKFFPFMVLTVTVILRFVSHLCSTAVIASNHR
jgi:hypothetical protein